MSQNYVQKIQDADIYDLAIETPIDNAPLLSQRLNNRVLLKREDLQPVFSFKLRGAYNKLLNLSEEQLATGVVAASAGNHAQGLALAAKKMGIAATIVMPRTTPRIKVDAVRARGAEVVLVGDSYDEAAAHATELVKQQGLTYIHPFDDPDVIAGQGTLGLELLEDIDDLELLIVPLGGGGLLAGTALAIKHHRPNVKIIGVQASVCAPFIHGFSPDGQVLTLADGIAVKQPGKFTKPIIDKYVDEIIEVDEDSIADAVVLLMEHSKMLVEGGGAVGLSTLLTQQITPAKTGSTCIVLSGGNIDIGLIPNLVRRNETNEGRRLTIFVRLPDRPGSLAGILDVCASNGANVIEVIHVREGIPLHPRETGIQLVLEVRGRDHVQEILHIAHANGFNVELAH